MAILPSVFKIPSFATNASVTSSIEIPGTFVYTYLEVPTMSVGFSTAATPIWLQGSSDGVTFRRYVSPEVNTSAAGANDFQIVSAATQRMVGINNFAMRYLKLEISGTATGVAQGQFNVIAVSNQ